VLGMEFISEIRRRHFVGGESISSIARSLQLSRPTVRKHLRTLEKPVYERQHQPCPKLGEFQGLLKQWLKIEGRLPKRQRRTAQRLFEGLQVEGYPGFLRSGPAICKTLERRAAKRACGYACWAHNGRGRHVAPVSCLPGGRVIPALVVGLPDILDAELLHRECSSKRLLTLPFNVNG
jgi:DNA-binding transcriptional ArsR family regulator